MIGQATFENLIDGWFKACPEKALVVFNEFVGLFDEILEQLSQRKANNKGKAKNKDPFISDMITQTRLLKAAHYGTVIHLLTQGPMPKSQEAIQQHLSTIIEKIDVARVEYAYLGTKVASVAKEHRIGGYLDVAQRQGLYRTLREYSQLFYIDPTTGKMQETINPKALLNKMQSENVPNVLHETLLLSKKMAVRLTMQCQLPLAWKFLQYFFAHVEAYLAARRGIPLAVEMEQEKVRVKEAVTNLLTNLEALIREGAADFSEDYAHIQILFGINKLPPEYRPTELTQELFTTLKSIADERLKEGRWKSLKTILSNNLQHVNERASLETAPMPHFMLPHLPDVNMPVLSKQLSLALKRQGCKFQLLKEKECLKTGNLYQATDTDIETFAKTYAALVDAHRSQVQEFAVTLSELKIDEVDRSKSQSGHAYRKEQGERVAKKKTRGIATPAPEPQMPDFPRSNKFVQLFGPGFRDAPIMPLRMKSMLNKMYVLLEANGDQDLQKLFQEPRQAVKIGDQGFKLSRLRSAQEVVLAAKLLGKGRKLRAYPHTKIIGSDRSSVLWIYRECVNKGSVPEKNHVMRTVNISVA
ncbi:MAG: hypothetical protein JSR37_02230 [Verrucomicrobia bacterium]|nr:hypothetical protein [Verrucomicrobiota bacterium]MBS0637786.1 hypothetical protein [Verrucomicrobiota bacterium]